MKFIGVAALCSVLIGCATRPPLAMKPAGIPTPISATQLPYTMATLDRAELAFADGHRESVEIGQDGTIVTPGGVDPARGLSRGAFEKLLHRRFPGIVKIEVTEFRPDEISILGEVFHQIHTSLGGAPMRVLDGIASANGFTPLANKRRVKLVRQNAGNVTVYELDLRQMLLGENIGQNLLLEPGDVITVPRNFL